MKQLYPYFSGLFNHPTLLEPVNFLEMYIKKCKKLPILVLMLLCGLQLYGQWTEVAPPLHARYEGPSVLKDGKIYIFGGFGPGYVLEPDVTVYDPSTDTWSYVTTLPIAVTHIGIALVNNNEVWIAGGRLWNDVQINNVQIYHFDTNSWSSGPSLPAPRGAGVLAQVGNMLHFFGGFGPQPAVADFDDHWVLDLNNQGAGWQPRAPFPLTRHHVGATVINGKIYVVGGQVDHDNTARDKYYAHSYDPATDTWTRLADLPGVNSHIEPGTFAYGTDLIMVGGENIRDKVYDYNPGTNTWNQIMTLPQGLLAPSAKVVNGKIYVTHGATGGGSGNPTVPTQKSYVATFPLGLPNNPPSFNIGGDQSVGQNSGFQTVPNFAYNIDDGDGGTQTLTFYVNNDNTGLFSVQPTIDASTGTLTYMPAANTVGNANVSVVLSDGISTTSPQQFTITVTTGSGGSPGNVLYRINCGGSQMADTPISWAEDKTSNPSPYVNSSQSNNTGGWDGFGGTNTTSIPEDIFGSRRWDGPWNDEMRWTFPVTNGDFEVRLYFVEYDAANGPGDRVFDVEVEGATAISNFDPYSEAGYNVGFQKTIFTTVNDGNLNIDFIRNPGSSDDPAVNAIEILAVQSGVFPVEFTSFEALHRQKQVLLSWSTEREENLSHFEIERSLNGMDFTSVGRTEVGATQGSNSYHYIDEVRMLNTLYYRIKAVDIDGTMTYSNIREVKMDIAAIQIYPNPTRGRLNVEVNGRDGKASMQLSNTQGKVLIDREVSLSGAFQRFSFQLEDLPAGIYLFTFKQHGIAKVQKVFVR